eukprot:s749_g14.t1
MALVAVFILAKFMGAFVPLLQVWQVIVSASSLVVATIQAVRAVRDSQRAFRASPEGKIQAAVAKAMEPFEPPRTKEEVIKRPVMDTIKNRIQSWRQHATIIGARYLSGKPVAVEEALRGVRGVVRFTINSADWYKMMLEQEKLDNIGHRTVQRGIDLISSTAKDVATDQIGVAIRGLRIGDLVKACENLKKSEPSPGLLNPYPSFRPSCGHVWPRGFPLDYVQAQHTFNRSIRVEQLERPPAVQQFLADEDPDVDAIFRLTRPLPCNFAGLEPGTPSAMAIPPQFFTPYNAQATVHLYEAFWGLLLPVTVHGRVSDIWRAYLTQKLLWDVGQLVTFLPPYVVHDRVAHDYLKDFQSEADLQLKSTALVQFLSQWSSNAPTLLERIEQLWAALYARGFVELGDVRLAQAWILDLLAVGYEFPQLKTQGNSPEHRREL